MFKVIRDFIKEVKVEQFVHHIEKASEAEHEGNKEKQKYHEEKASKYEESIKKQR